MAADDLKALLEFQPDHLAWPLERNCVELWGEAAARDYLVMRKAQIDDAARDPLRYQYFPDIWEVADRQIRELRAKHKKGVIKLVIFGGNRSSKTRYASRKVMDDLSFKPNRRWWCCDSTEAMSRTNQMRLMWEQFPPEWRGLDRTAVTKINYSIADGFSSNVLVCPNKSEAAFKFYSMDVKNLPGPELDGIWADELIPLEWVQTLVYRLINRNGILIITFTPELGWNETFGHFYEGAETLEEADAELLPLYDGEGNQTGYRKMPRVMQCSDPTARILFFHTVDNPFGNYPALVQELQGKSENEITIRAYGLASKAHDVAFPRFARRAHVITPAEFQLILKEHKNGERYHMVDPCDGRNWFMIWVYCPYPDKWIIYREWPSHGHKSAYIDGVGMIGPWALSGAAADGVKGPAQQSFGFSLEAYRDEIINQEGGESIDARYIDSRYATSPRTDRERVTTLIEQLTEVGIDFMAMTAGKGRIIGTESNDGSVDLINNALYYDAETELGKFSPKMQRINEPRLQVVDTCPNTIYALEHWTGQDGQKGACKDPIDVIRGLFLSSINFLGEDQYRWKGGGLKQ